MGSIHLIKFADKETRIRAIGVFRHVDVTRVRFPGDVMGVTDEHIEALRKANVPFQFVSKEPPNGTGSASVQP
jgi:hypothetical protein